jgi:hypothetical protein
MCGDNSEDPRTKPHFAKIDVGQNRGGFLDYVPSALVSGTLDPAGVRRTDWAECLEPALELGCTLRLRRASGHIAAQPPICVGNTQIEFR